MSAALRFENVALRRGGRLLFEGLSFELQPGQALRVMGPNGSGKSSLIRLAAGLLPAERGRVDRGQAALANDHLALDRELALGQALGFWVRDAQASMDALGIAHLAAVPVRLLSSGQAKRATLARVVASNAQLWLVDEPLNGLDSAGAKRFFDVVERHLATGGAVVAASHQPMPGNWTALGLGG